MLKYIIFDFDGTLVDSKDVAIAVFNKLAQKHNFNRLEQKDIENFRRLSIMERAKFLKFPLYKVPFLAVDFYSLYKESLKKLSLFPGIRELLKELDKRGYQIAVISSNSEQNIREFLQDNEINYIKHVICSNQIFGKDRMIKKFLAAHNLRSSEVIYVGDEQRDIMACKKCGVKVIWVEWGFDVLDIVKKEEPDYIVQRPQDILTIIP